MNLISTPSSEFYPQLKQVTAQAFIKHHFVLSKYLVIIDNKKHCQMVIKQPSEYHQTLDFFKDVSFHVSFHDKFGYMVCCDFSINNPQNTCLVT